MNDLDRAIIAMGRSQAALPELMRQLTEGELWFLTPYHPEIEGEEIEVTRGMNMPFSTFQDAEGPHVPMYSSQERLDEALAGSGLPVEKFLAAAMPALQALGMLGGMELRAALNKGCRTTGELMLPPNMMRALANGTAFSPTEDPESVEMEVAMVDPADYPTELIQAAFEILRKHRNFRAVWLAEHDHGNPTPAGGRHFQFLALMDPRDAAIFHEFNLVVQSAAAPHDAGVGYLDESAPESIAQIWQQTPPFYVAADFSQPPTP